MQIADTVKFECEQYRIKSAGAERSLAYVTSVKPKFSAVATLYEAISAMPPSEFTVVATVP